MLQKQFGQHVASRTCQWVAMWLISTAGVAAAQPAGPPTGPLGAARPGSVWSAPPPAAAPRWSAPPPASPTLPSSSATPAVREADAREVIRTGGRPGTAGSRRLLIRLPGTETPGGATVQGPQVQVLPATTPRDPRQPGWTSGNLTSGRLASGEPLPPGGEFLPGVLPPGEAGLSPEVLPPPSDGTWGLAPEVLPGEPLVGGPGGPIFDDLLADSLPPPPRHEGFLARWLRPRVMPFEDRGLGYERVGLAPMELDITQPQNNIRLRFDSAYGFEFPDRAEYFWARVGGRGPDERFARFEQVDYQDIRFMFEVGGPSFSVQTEVPIRFIDGQDLYYNTAGFGDMSVKTKLLMIDGRRFQLTQYFGTYMPTGAPGHGTGTGHTTIEPGFLFRYMLNDLTYWHGELKYWVPLGGDPNHSGQILRWGTGLSYLWYDSDSLAIMPTLELVSWTVLDGRKTIGPLVDGVAPYLEVDGETTVNLFPGLRVSYDSGGDLGLFELGVQGGFAITETYWYAGLLRLEMRFVY